jgi:hypothetical protein
VETKKGVAGEGVAGEAGTLARALEDIPMVARPLPLVWSLLFSLAPLILLCWAPTSCWRNAMMAVPQASRIS